jgi:hypothetical protein
MAARTEAEQASVVSASGSPAPTAASTPRIECHHDLRAFFHETLTRALATRKVEAPPNTEYYLVGLLELLGHDTAPLSRSLVELEVDATSQAEDASRLERLRTLGDQALSVTGLFDAHLERHGISRAYVADVGARAYRNAGQLAGVRRGAHAAVFLDLGERFSTYADVLEQVRETTVLGTPDDVLSLYERYQRTHSPALMERLASHGVFAVSETSEPRSGAC